MSAVDAHVAKHLFQHLIGPKGILKNSTRIIVTHNLSFLDEVDTILMLDDGEIIFKGTFDEFKENSLYSEITQSKLNDKSKTDNQNPLSGNESQGNMECGEKKIIEEEERKEGRVSLKNYIHYIKIINVYIFMLIVSLYILGEAIMVGCNLVLVKWTDQVEEIDFKVEDHVNYIWYYGGLNIAMCLVSGVYNIWTYFAMTKPSQNLHKLILDQTMHAPLSFFESNPSGRILNRFTSDIEVVDKRIPFELADVLYCSVNFISVCITVSVIIPHILIAMVPVIGGYIFLQILMSRTRCQIKRYEAVAKAPILSLFSEAIEGASTIRAFREVKRFEKEFEGRLSKHLKANYVNDMMNKWLSVRVDVLGNILVFLVAILTFAFRDSLSSGLAGLAITYAMMIIDSLGWNIRMICDLETDSVAIERLKEYENIEQEEEWETTGIPADWPQTSELSISDVSVRYRKGLPDCLSQLNLHLQASTKLGVCGRTGAGKSSLASLLLRIIQPHEGFVKLSGIKTHKLGLHQLRNAITIVPQVGVQYADDDTNILSTS